MNLIEDPVSLQCQRCHKRWSYRGKNPYVASCPYCHTHVWIRKNRLQTDQQVRSHNQSTVVHENNPGGLIPREE